MSKVLVTETHLEDIAAAIRRKLGVATLYRPGEMAGAIRSIETYPEPAGEVSITQNGQANVKDYATANVSVPNTYAAADEGKVVSGGALIAQTARAQAITANGTYDTTENSSVTVNVEGGGGGITGFELYSADGNGGARTHRGTYDNAYLACYFDDNMSSAYTLNGNSYTFSCIATGKQQTLATTRAVADNSPTVTNGAVIQRAGSLFTASHGDSGSYISVVGGWVGYLSGGAIFENAATGTGNTITLDAVYTKLLVFVGACFDSDGVTTVEINGSTYTIDNIGNHYGAYGVYGAIEIDNNADTVVTATFSASGRSYMSIIGL